MGWLISSRIRNDRAHIYHVMKFVLTVYNSIEWARVELSERKSLIFLLMHHDFQLAKIVCWMFIDTILLLHLLHLLLPFSISNWFEDIKWNQFQFWSLIVRRASLRKKKSFNWLNLIGTFSWQLENVTIFHF